MTDTPPPPQIPQKNKKKPPILFLFQLFPSVLFPYLNTWPPYFFAVSLTNVAYNYLHNNKVTKISKVGTCLPFREEGGKRCCINYLCMHYATGLSLEMHALMHRHTQP